MELIEKIKDCQTMRELDELRIDIIKAAESGGKIVIMDRNEKIQKIARFYGYDAQSRQCIEECSELIQAINKYWRKRDGQAFKDVIERTKSKDNMLEEIADVQIMLWQMVYLLNADVTPIIEQKLNRQLERIKCDEGQRTND